MTDLIKITDIEDYCKNKPDTHIFRNFETSEDDKKKYKEIINEMNLLDDLNKSNIKLLWKKFKGMPTKPRLMETYLDMIENDNFPISKKIESYLISHQVRAKSGVSVCAVFLSPYPNGQKFSCRWNCHYCPNEPGQPRSYLFGEPGVLRANQNNFDCIEQIYSRIRALRLCGHPSDKLEILILGGTIHSYPKDYLEDFMRDIFYAANTCITKHSRSKSSLIDEQTINEASDHRIIGITIETRPDCITPKELQDFRRWGVTRVQIGVQHTDDNLLKRVNRGHGLKHTMKACQLLRDSCFKFDIHLMPNLPDSTPEKDIDMMNYVLENINPDQVKMYPTTITPFTRILDDYKSGKYIPYNNEELEKVIIYWLSNVHPWIRNNRIVRDIPNYYIVDGIKSSNQKQEFDQIMKEKGLKCKCIRSRESGNFDEDPKNGELVVRTYDAHDGKEYFISWESKDREVIFGFCRLRITKNQTIDIFPELENCALIRELHVYGKTLKVNDSNLSDDIINDNENFTVKPVQHIGIGKTLMNKAEEIAKENNFKKICVIAGIGTRNYYRKLGYDKIETFMIKNI